MKEAWNPLEGERPELDINLHNGTDEQISIIIVHKDTPEYLNICLQTIAVTSFNNNYEIIVVDNASTTQDSIDYLKEIEDSVTVIRNKENLYWSAAANKGAEAANKNSKYYVFMHCDVAILNPAWLDLLINVCESQKSGMVGVEMQSYNMLNKKVDFIKEWLVLFTKECFNDCGHFPEKLPMVGQNFVMTLKAQNLGYKPQLMKNTIAHHYKIFGIDISVFEKMVDQAQIEIPKLIKEVQSQTVKNIIV